MTIQPIRVGILGGGNISDTHARAARETQGVEIVAVYGQNPAKAARLAQLYGGQRFDSLDRFLAHQPMDLVAIGSPSGLHAEQGIAAAERGLHVLVEKPLDISTQRCDAFIAAADRARVRLGVFFQDRLKPDVVRMKEMVDSGILGQLILASGHVKWYRPPDYYADSRWRGTHGLDGGGALINQAIHTVDLLLHLVGPIVSVDARIATRLHDIQVEDTAVATLQFANGALGVFEASTAVFPGYARRVEITGAGGTLILEHDQLIAADLTHGPLGSGLEFQHPRSPSRSDVKIQDLTPKPPKTPLNAASPTVADATPHRRVLEDFVHAVRTSGTPACDGREGRRSVAVVEAIYASARAQQPVTIG
jgi:UDP-N-acetyl-2-amino-2-deoxyglucuronate dehydrogenase